MPEHCDDFEPIEPKRIRFGLARTDFDLRTLPISLLDSYSIYEINTSTRSPTVDPAVLGAAYPKPDTELVSREGNFMSHCYVNGWWADGAEFDLKCHTTGATTDVDSVYGKLLFRQTTTTLIVYDQPHQINTKLLHLHIYFKP